MRKMITCGLLAAAALSAAAPAFAGDDSGSGPGVNAAGGWDFSGAGVCRQELAVVPALGDAVGDCSHGNVLDHAGTLLPSPARH
ncbi:hypothetical protein ACFY9A_23875 [Streptomyces rubradiris]|uniref:hypothetical protein n=1 Tax=Streptomyces rubradiris TaxID=285531 RepID=UPI0036E3C712